MRACARVLHVHVRATAICCIPCICNLLSFFIVRLSFFKVVILFELYSFAPLTLKPLLQMLPFEFYQIVAYPLDLLRRVRYKNYETFPAAVSGVSHFLSSSSKVYVYRCIVPFEGNISRRMISSYEPE